MTIYDDQLGILSEKELNEIWSDEDIELFYYLSTDEYDELNFDNR